MNLKERIKKLRALDSLVRSLNDEDLINVWLMNGVADGDQTLPDEDWEIYVDTDEDFRDIIHLGLKLLTRAVKEESGIYIDDVVSC